MNINKYTRIIHNNISLTKSINLILQSLSNDLLIFGFNSGFIAYLDENRIDKRFKILCSNGKFLNNNNINVITSKEIDGLSIVYMTKKNTFKDNFYIDIIEKNNKDVFIYLEFDKILNDKQKNIINIFFRELNDLMRNKNWELI